MANTQSSFLREIIFKLLAFTVAMITFPIASYFISVDLIFGGMSQSLSCTVYVPSPLEESSNICHLVALNPPPDFSLLLTWPVF
jgi:hypothetical protein